MHRVAVALSIVLVGWSKVLAYFVARDALVGSPFGPWSSDPIVLWGELILAACSALLSVVAARFIVRRFRAGSAGSAGTKLAIGLGFLAVGALGIAVGWLGLRVPTTPGSDFLERGEPLFIIDGVIAAAFGLLVTFAAIVAAGLRRSSSLTPPQPPDAPAAAPSARRPAGPTHISRVTPAERSS